MEENQKQCAVCGLKSTLKCSVCKQVYYCGRKHQKTHWKVHKKECAKMKQQNAEEDQKPLELECAVCGVSESSAHLKLCAGCQMIAYCGKEHQLQHWREGKHHSKCPKVEYIREKISSDFAEIASKNSDYPQFHGDPRFQQLEQDLENGAKRRWLRHALELSVFLAEANIEGGYFNLGIIYHNGFGVKQDTEKAVNLYRKAADQGLFEAQNNLGICYRNGEGVPKDMSEAVKWFRKAADQGNAEAQFNLGLRYYYGEGIPRNPSEAVKLFRKAADQGYTLAQFNLGVFYGNGEGVPKNTSEAVKWFRKAADQGNAEAQFKLGLHYYNGEGIPKDLNESAKWYHKAADQGHAIAQVSLGRLYMSGEGVPKNMNEAVKWLQKAADQGNQMAIEAVKMLNK